MGGGITGGTTGGMTHTTLVLRAALHLALHVVLLAGPAAIAAPEIEFASAEDARSVLGERDAFVARLSPFDRAARLRSAGDVTEAEYLDFVRDAPLEWTHAERERVRAAFTAIAPALTALLPPVDEPILLIKTSGAEEGDAAAYTRGNAVILAQPTLLGGSLERTLAHEIFHVVSRSAPALRRALYALIGFEHCGEVAHPESLAPRRITNPDAPVNDHCIRVGVDGDEAWAVPILFAAEATVDPAAARPLFDDLQMALLLVRWNGGEGTARPIVRDDGSAALVPIDRVSGFFEQIGRNTSYVLHPEEIIASNFELLATGAARVPSPELLERIQIVMTTHAQAGE